MTPAGQLTVLYNFDGTHGNTPRYTALVQASNGKFYGTTIYSAGVRYDLWGLEAGVRATADSEVR